MVVMVMLLVEEEQEERSIFYSIQLRISQIQYRCQSAVVMAEMRLLMKLIAVMELVDAEAEGLFIRM